MREVNLAPTIRRTKERAMKFFLFRVSSALLISIVAGLMLLGAFALAPQPAHAAAAIPVAAYHLT
jgi:hypothetical protein